MAYIITLKTPQMKIYIREPLVGGEWTREEWERRGGAALEPKGDFETMNDQAFRETLLERPFLVCRKFTTGLRAVIFLENVALIEQVPDDQARKMVQEIKAMMEAEMEKAGTGPGGRKVTIPPFMGPGFKIPGGH